MAYTTIKKPSDYFNTKLYTGNGSTQSITGVGFQPDLVWFKSRTTSNNNAVFDIVRGATNWIETNSTNAEATYSGGLTSFDSDGFSVGNGSDVNLNGSSQVAWNWLGANGTAINTDGSITSTVSANTTSGFSIVSYTGTGANATVGHGLGSVPKMIIVKKRSGTSSWAVYNENIGNANGLFLNGTSGTSSEPAFWNSTSPTSSVFSVGTSGDTNGSGATEIAYCFAEVKGFSKFGSYTGNGNADGTFVYTGFKPAFVIVKSSSAVESWYTYDNKRNTFNPLDKGLVPNQNIAEFTFTPWDFLSNGFKARQNWSGNNSNGVSYIYMAFAEEPLVGDNPATAR